MAGSCLSGGANAAAKGAMTFWWMSCDRDKRFFGPTPKAYVCTSTERSMTDWLPQPVRIFLGRIRRGRRSVWCLRFSPGCYLTTVIGLIGHRPEFAME